MIQRLIDGRSDIYSLGVIGYRAIAGRLPFVGSSIRDVISQHITTAPEPLPADRAAADPGLADAILRSLSKEPAARWQRARDFAASVREDAGEEILPEELSALDGGLTDLMFGTLGLGLVFVGIWALGVDWLTGRETAKVLLGCSVASVVMPALLTLGYRFERKVPLARTWLLGWRPPRSWKYWWPQRFRRPGDVWHRLPDDLRTLRLLNLGALIFFFPSFLLFMARVVSGQHDAAVQWFVLQSQMFQNSFIVGLLAIAGLAVASLVWFTHQLSKRFAVSTAFLLQIQHLYNVDARWRQDRYARLLSPETTTSRPPADVTGRRDAIEQLVRELQGTNVLLPEGLLDAVRAADTAAADIMGEIQRLRVDVDPDEIAKIDRRIAALGASPRDADVRNLLQAQRDLMSKLETRHEGLTAHKTRLDEQLRLLHRQLLEMRARGAESHAEITGQIRAVNDELRRLGEGWSDAERLTTPA